MFVLYMAIAGASAFIQPEEHTEAARNCQFQGKYFKKFFRVEGEPVVLRCPQVQPWMQTSAGPHFITWHRNDTGGNTEAGDERLWVQDQALWILPALRRDSGTYVCSVRNASYCDEMSVELRVFEKTEASIPFTSYLQILTLSTSGLLVCPELSEFTRNTTDLNIQWYKDSVLLDQDSNKFQSLRGTTRLFIRNVSETDGGYYSCDMAFSHNGTRYTITRNIKVRINEKEEEPIPVIVSPHQTILASMGSRLTIPCKVFLGVGVKSISMVWWTANDTIIDNAYPDGRVTEGPDREYSENNENYVEVPLIFDPVKREDLDTDFKCTVTNRLSFQTLRTMVKEASTFSWGMAVAPLSLVFLVLGGIFMHRWCKHRTRKAYGLPTMKIEQEDI
ncbi:PREDICTED: interleukin-1 receptor type 2 [Elephantulus edwardii]|uniref:interleukin-1 receptor type 2 n=1 Tax=Elephantulus edwardii TaxID=28737 RepID=UPI0003F07A44|nr:PREDICTED: interleukin-1 receptor type 2 [Elephantulus edwardii]